MRHSLGALCPHPYFYGPNGAESWVQSQQGGAGLAPGQAWSWDQTSPCPIHLVVCWVLLGAVHPPRLVVVFWQWRVAGAAASRPG